MVQRELHSHPSPLNDPDDAALFLYKMLQAKMDQKVKHLVVGSISGGRKNK